MILGIGTDIIANKRIEFLYHKYGLKFLNRVYTQDEIQYAQSRKDPIPYLSGRFAVKEAAIKAFGSQEYLGIKMRDISVEGQNLGKKKLVFYNKALAFIKNMGVDSYHFSLSHSKEASIAIVAFEGKRKKRNKKSCLSWKLNDLCCYVKSKFSKKTTHP